MPREVRLAGDFITDVGAQVAYLRERGQWSWIERLRSELQRSTDLIRAFPGAGEELGARGSETLRRLRLRGLPFYLWYQFDRSREDGPVTLYRLFHARQRRRVPQFWTPADER